jgi:predicted secreted protein
MLVAVFALALVSAMVPLFPIVSAATPPTGWSKTYGGAGDDKGWGDLYQTSDGGYAISGDTASFGAGGADYWLVKVDAAGNMLWNKTYGGNGTESENAMVQTSDGGYAMLGVTGSFGAGGNDFWLVKTDAAGNMQWNKTYGGTGSDIGVSVFQTNDGGYAVSGLTSSFGAGSMDVWLVKTDSVGNMQWNKTYGGTGADYGFSVVQTSDGGYAISGPTTSFGAGGQDVWLVKTDAAGNMQWNKTYGGTGMEWMDQMIRTADGGYAISGYTTSFGAGGQDVWLVKTDAAGNMQWNKTYGGTGSDDGFHLVQTGEGGYAIIGSTVSFGAGGTDVWLVKTDAAGNMQWNKTYGGANTDLGYSVVQTSDGGYAIAGYTNSFGAGGNDFYVVKTDASGLLPYKAPPAASAFTSVSVLPGWTWTFFVHSNGGVGAHTYQWYDTSGPLAGQTSMVLPVAKNAPGTYTFYCKVTDSEGTSANSNNVTLTVMG